MKRTVDIAFVLVAALGLGACASLAPPDHQTTMGNNHDIHFTDAMSRSIHVFRGTPDPEEYRVCVEPSPDVGLAQTEELEFGGLSASGMGDVFGEGGDAAINSGGFRRDSGRVGGEQLLNRTTGLQVFRDTLSQACLAYAQGVIEEEEYADFIRAAAAGAIAMSAIESMTETEASFWSTYSRQGGQGGEVDHDEIYDLAQLSMYILMMTYSGEGDRVRDNLQELYDIRIRMRELELQKRQLELNQLSQ